MCPCSLCPSSPACPSSVYSVCQSALSPVLPPDRLLPVIDRLSVVCPATCPSYLPFVRLSLHLCVCPSTWPSVPLPVRLSRHMFVCPATCPWCPATCPFVPPPVRLSRHPFVCAATCPSVQSLVRLSRHLFICPSICSSVPPPVRLTVTLVLLSPPSPFSTLRRAGVSDF